MKDRRRCFVVAASGFALNERLGAFARRTQKPPFKGQALLHCTRRTVTYTLSSAEHYPRISKTSPKIQNLCHNKPSFNNRPSFLRLHAANQTPPGIPFSAKAHAGIARRAGRSPSEARKLPEQKPRSLRGMVGYGRPLKADPWEWKYTTSPAGSSGGSAEGASEGRQPLTGPHLPPAAQAAQTKIKKTPRARRAQKPSLKEQARFLLYEAAAT